MWQAAAAEFVQWFMDTSCEDYTRSMTAAHPGHFLIQVLPDGKQEVIEPIGGSSLPTRLVVDHDDTSTLVAPPAPGTDAQAAGVALSGESVPIGGVRHEFRDVPGDFRARLCVEFAPHQPGRQVRPGCHLQCPRDVVVQLCPPLG